jgi:tight adherence protein B
MSEMTLFLLLILCTTMFFFFLIHFLFPYEKRLERRFKQFLQFDHKDQRDQKFKHFVNISLKKAVKKPQPSFKRSNEKLEIMLNRAGLPLRPEEYIMFKMISAAFVALLLYLVFGEAIFFIVGGGIGYVFPKWLINRKQKKRLEKFNLELPDMIATIVGSLRAGFSFTQALKTVVEEANGPIKEEMERVIKDMQYGTSLEEALNELKIRMPSEDLDLMIQAIVIQRQVGGNLATVLEKIVQTVRDRQKIQRQIITLTAQGRLSGIVIGLLPVFVGTFIYFIEPNYIGLLFEHPIGMIMLGLGVVSACIGFFIIRKMTVIEV